MGYTIAVRDRRLGGKGCNGIRFRGTDKYLHIVHRSNGNDMGLVEGYKRNVIRICICFGSRASVTVDSKLFTILKSRRCNKVDTPGDNYFVKAAAGFKSCSLNFDNAFHNGYFCKAGTICESRSTNTG